MRFLQKDSLKIILHFALLIAILALFTKLTVDAIILGAIAMFIYQVKNERDTTFSNRNLSMLSSSENHKGTI